MSHIPSSAMPHAGQKTEGDKQKNDKQEASSSSLSDRAGKIADKARENPKTAIAAGAAVLAGAVAAAAIPLMKNARSKADGKSGSGTTKKPAAKKKS